MDGQLRVDEQPLVPAHDRRDPVAGVGHREHALQRRRLLAGDDADLQPRPGGRRPVIEPAARREADLDRVAVAEVVRRRRLGLRAGRRRTGIVAGRGRFVRGSRQARAVMTGRPPALSCASSSSTVRPGLTTRLSTSTSATGTGPRISNVTRASSVPSRGSVPSSARPSKRGRRPRVLAADVPRPGGVLRRAEAPVAERLVEGLAHRRRWNSASRSLECIAPIRSRSGSRPERDDLDRARRRRRRRPGARAARAPPRSTSGCSASR